MRKAIKRIATFLGKALAAAALLCIAVVVGANALVLISAEESMVTTEGARNRGADAIVVLGASVYPDGTPSDILRARLDDAVELYQEGAARKIIASGDNGDLHYNESSAMKEYLVSQGVPSQDVFCDYAGFSTYDSIYRAKNVFGAKSIVVATQKYHLPRALFAAKALGLDAVGAYVEEEGAYQNQFLYDLREVPARMKDVLQALSNAPSTMVGDPIDLNGSGDQQ